MKKVSIKKAYIGKGREKKEVILACPQNEDSLAGVVYICDKSIASYREAASMLIREYDGVICFVTCTGENGEAAALDCRNALLLLKRNAGKLGIDPDKLFIAADDDLSPEILSVLTLFEGDFEPDEEEACEEEKRPPMQYRSDRYGNPVSALGYGCMRFSQTAGIVDKKKTQEEIMEAYRSGVNYFDTAYIYGQSESVLGEILEKNGIRDQVNIATKLPHYLIKSMASLEKTFEEQCRRLRTDRIDYYLMHMLTDLKTWEKLCDMGIEDWIRRMKAEGRIGQIGFSYHGNPEMFMQLIDAYDWDFCQIQYNYLDEHSQAGRRGLMYAAERKIPVVIMEPLRGGRLAKLPAQAQKLMEAYPVSRSAAEWSFDWLWDQPQIMCVLSGMNSLSMVSENVASACRSHPGMLTKEDQDLIADVKAVINASMKVGCTGCRYCMPCPKGVDIPGIFAAYNRTATDSKFRGQFDYFMCTGIRKDSSAASNCVGCGKCEKHCPQHIEIRKELKEAGALLEGSMYKVGRKAITVMKAY